MQVLALFTHHDTETYLHDVGGITLAQRLARSASLSGASEIVCLGATDDVLSHLNQDRELKCGVRKLQGAEQWDDLFAVANRLEDEFIVLDANQVYTPAVVRQVMNQAAGDWGAVLTSRDGELVAAKLYTRVLRKFAQESRLDRTLEAIAAGSPVTLGISDAKVLMKVHSKEDALVAMKKLRRTLRKPLGRQHDGITAYLLNRPISLSMSRWLMYLPVHPNHVTAFGLILSFFAAYLLSTGDPTNMALGALMMQLISITDGVDGELARMKLLMSENGAKFDAVTDDVTKFGLFMGLGLGSAKLLGDASYLWIMWTGVAFTVSMLCVFYYELFFKGKTNTLNAVKWWWEEEGAEPTLWHRFLVGFSYCLKRDTYTFGLTMIAAVGFPQVSFVAMFVGISIICFSTFGQRLVSYTKRPALEEMQDTVEVSRAA